MVQICLDFGIVNMAAKTGLLLIALFVGCLASPAPETNDFSDFFYHTDPAARIVGGDQAAEGSVPHMVALSSGLLIRSFLCGGSLVTQRHVVTAAHCIEAVYSWGSLSSTLRGTVGTNRWNLGGISYDFSRNVTHPHYLASVIKNDIGVLVTSGTVTLTHLINPVPLSFVHVDGGVRVKVNGWGRIRANGALSSTLLELYWNTITGQQCIEAVEAAAIAFNVRAPPVEPALEICTFHSEGHGTCNGDSGSALVRADNGLQVGVVSWGFPCARGAPDMFARVSGFTDFLNTALAYA